MDRKRTGKPIANNGGIHFTCEQPATQLQKKKQKDQAQQKIYTHTYYEHTRESEKKPSPTCQKCIIRVSGRTPIWQAGKHSHRITSQMKCMRLRRADAIIVRKERNWLANVRQRRRASSIRWWTNRKNWCRLTFTCVNGVEWLIGQVASYCGF